MGLAGPLKGLNVTNHERTNAGYRLEGLELGPRAHMGCAGPFRASMYNMWPLSGLHCTPVAAWVTQVHKHHCPCHAVAFTSDDIFI
jgi:hypothetical protein